VHFKVTAPQRFIVLSKFVKPLTRTMTRDFVAAAQLGCRAKAILSGFQNLGKERRLRKDLIVLARCRKCFVRVQQAFLNWYRSSRLSFSGRREKEIEAVGEEGKSEDASMRAV